MPTYSAADEAVQDIIRDLVEEDYPDLLEARATIGAIFAYPKLDDDGEPTGPAVTQYGMVAQGKLKVNGEADRVEGKRDATITIDHAAWREKTDNQRRAFVDRFLHAIQVRKKDGMILTDDRGRPLLVAKKPDWIFTGYAEMAIKHGADSVERMQAKQLEDAFGQILFGFMGTDPAAGSEGPARPMKKRKAKNASVSAANR